MTRASPAALLAAVPPGPGRDARRGRLDVAGAGLSTLAAVLLILGCNRVVAGYCAARPGRPGSTKPEASGPGRRAASRTHHDARA